MKKKIIILGTSGMLGHTLLKYLHTKTQKVIYYGFERDIKNSKKKNIFKFINFNSKRFFSRIKKINPDIIINCVGIINHRLKKNNLLETYFINSVLPHVLAYFSYEIKSKLIHVSTDCVFNGKNGNYNEKYIPNAIDVYGFSKIVGEPEMKNCITIRTSIIGPEKKNKLGLLEWFLNQKKIKGYKNIFFSGLTTLELSKIIYKYFIVKNYIHSGIVHISGPKIAKYDLLKLINNVYKKNIKITPIYLKQIDKSLNSAYFTKITNYKKKKWKTLLTQMKNFNDKAIFK